MHTIVVEILSPAVWICHLTWQVLLYISVTEVFLLMHTWNWNDEVDSHFLSVFVYVCCYVYVCDLATLVGMFKTQNWSIRDGWCKWAEKPCPKLKNSSFYVFKTCMLAIQVSAKHEYTKAFHFFVC